MHTKDCKKSKEVEDEPTYSEEQRKLYRNRQKDWNTLKILSENEKDVET